MSNNEIFECPICKKLFDSPKSFSTHISLTKEIKHIKLATLKRQHSCQPNKVHLLYIKYKDFIENESGGNQEVLNNVIENKCKISCAECKKEWIDEFNACNSVCKQAFLHSNECNNVPEKKEKKKSNETNIPSLLNYFYSLSKTKSPDYAKEVGQLKSYIVKQNMPIEDIKIVLSYLARKGYTDIKFFSNVKNEALLEHKYLQEVDTEGTAAYLVKYFYKKMNMDINLQTFMKDIKKINETLFSLSYDQVKYVLDYMINKKCYNINFIGNMKTQALLDMNNSKNINNNPSFFSSNEIENLKSELKFAKIKLSNLKPSILEEAKMIARQLYMNGDIKYSRHEWAWRIGLELDYEMYLLLDDITTLSFEKLLTTKTDLDDLTKNKIIQKRKEFDKWINSYHSKFSNFHQVKIK